MGRLERAELIAAVGGLLLAAGVFLRGYRPDPGNPNARNELSWPRGQLGAVLGMTAYGLVAYTGVPDRPGTPSGAVDLSVVFLLAFVGSVLMIACGVLAAGQTERARNPRGSCR